MVRFEVQMNEYETLVLVLMWLVSVVFMLQKRRQRTGAGE